MDNIKRKNNNRFCEAKRYLLKTIEEILTSANIEKIDDVVTLILNSNKIFVYGVGRSGLVGKAFAMRLVQLGLKAYFIGETITPIVEDSDLVVIVSRTGETYSAIQTANIVRRVGAKLIVITSHKGSKLSHAGNIVVYLYEGKNKNKSLAPLGTLFEESTFILFDCLVAEIMHRKDESDDTMRSRHAIWV